MRLQRADDIRSQFSSHHQVFKYFILFAPFTLASLFDFVPIASYLIAWSGSFFIFFVVLTGRIKPLPSDRPVSDQLMRPVFLVQIIFAGYMSCTSIFYFWSNLGYYYSQQSLPINEDALALIAQCQRYYCLGHAALVTGILVFMKYPVMSKYYIEKQKVANLLLTIALVAYPLSLLFLASPGLSQFYFQLNSLSFIAGTLALAFALPMQKLANLSLCLILYAFNFYSALLSGFKEPIIISVVVLGVFLYPSYKKMVVVTFIPLLLILFLFLPSYVNSFRGSTNSGEESSDNASRIALDEALNGDSMDETNWGFLVYRLSEIDMFTHYVKSTPDDVAFYKLQLVKQSLIAIVPRFFWPTKPITEDLIMERVYNANVINRGSSASAKPAVIVDAYLSYGAGGILICLFVYGALAQLISIRAEKLFGGYVMGCALIFSGLFQVFWRGLSFEFLVNSVFWSYVSMWVIFKLLRVKNIIKVRDIV
ncbi:hypothetical protein SAMN05216464_103429 [Mucilaginibacter pineti]|uniref:Oligosaccharide repeat unit polymerase n=1 Tax=Mucilaginibacter pineti TaxID=1391627 RepID=A0A1G6ZPA3_9SPHI|nr:hypothetical protein [Mucilaginibacter pineti]SDE04047.1 hypothetical protein SAMN05216464_103429 [Mucilaginibacter pineti]